VGYFPLSNLFTVELSLTPPKIDLIAVAIDRELFCRHPIRDKVQLP
jgi:hypothetical protein